MSAISRILHKRGNTLDTTDPMIVWATATNESWWSDKVTVSYRTSDDKYVSVHYVLVSDTQTDRPTPQEMLESAMVYKSGSGIFYRTVTGLTPSTTYYTYVMVRDAAGNYSDVKSTLPFTTEKSDVIVM